MENYNPLDANPKVRSALYLVQWLWNLAFGIAGIVLLALGLEPLWFIIAGSVASFVWTYTGLAAKRHVPDPATVPGEVVQPSLFDEVDDSGGFDGHR